MPSGARSLSEHILASYPDGISFQSFTGRALTDCCSMLSSITVELNISPLVITSTGTSTEWKHLFQYCQPLLETAQHSLVLSTVQQKQAVVLDPSDPLLTEWFLLVFSQSFSFLLLAQTSSQSDPNNISVLISYDSDITHTAAKWLASQLQAHEIEAMLAEKCPPTKRERFYDRVLRHFSANLNRTPVEHERIEQEMEATLYKLALSNSELAVLNTMLELISRSLDLQEIYQGLLKAVEVVDIDAAIILLIDDEKNLNIDFFGGATLEVSEAIKSIATDMFKALGHKFPTDIQILYTDEVSPQFRSLSRVLIAAGIKTVVGVPLHSRDTNIGFMVLPSASHRNFSTDDCRLLSNIGSQVGIAIESARLYEKSQRLARQMGALFEVGKTISAHLELQPLLSSIAESAGKLLDADQTAVVFLEEKDGSIKTSVEWCLHSEKPMALSEMARAKALSDACKESPEAIIDSHNGSSVILFPIVVSERNSSRRFVLGSLCAMRCRGEKIGFNRSDLELLNNLVSQVAVAVENAELYAGIVEANEKLREAIRLKDELVSMVAHDFRSPLTSIQAFSEMLQDRIEDPEYKRFLGIINRQSKHLASLAADTLTMSRLESGNMPFKFNRFKFNELITSLIESRAAADASVDLKLELPDEEVEIVGDYGRLYEVMDNLVSNAVKYSPDGAFVRVRMSRIDDCVHVSVIDRGMGISPEDLPKLFQKFSRLDAARQRQISGTGLGLYICRCIIEAHRGSIWVESTRGEGSAFHFKLPCNLDCE